MGYQKYNSWTIISKNKCVKKIDKSFKEYAETGIPQGMREFFEISDLTALVNKPVKIILEHKSEKIEAKILLSIRDSSKRTKMDFPKKLVSLLSEGNGELQDKQVLFEKIDAEFYRLEIVTNESSKLLLQENYKCDLCEFEFLKHYTQHVATSEFYEQVTMSDDECYDVCPNCITVLQKNGLSPSELKENIQIIDEQHTLHLLDDTKIFI